MTNPVKAQKRALVVDDDDTVMEHITKMLGTRGFNVAQEFDGMAALQRCRAEKFDVVICDIRMPRLSGISFLRNLRQSEMNSAVPGDSPNSQPPQALSVVMMSSLGDNATKREIIAAGTPYFLLKPVTGAALDAVLVSIGLGAQ